jgi:4-diphosphocytidyl-2-C-methyl-D-erythritol kinase
MTTSNPKDAVTLAAPAKINVTLLVTGKRADGYHELATLLAPLALADQITVRRSAAPGVRLEVAGADLPNDERNLAYRAAAAVIAAADLPFGFDLRLTKNVPVGAGLGGGSSDAAAVLTAANDIAGSPLSADALWRLGRGLGADVPFFLGTGWALATGRGEFLTRVRGPAGVRFLLVAPAEAVSTARVYAEVTAADYGRDADGLWDLIARLEEPVAAWWPRGVNNLEAAATRVVPPLADLKKLLTESGFPTARLSGSGGTFVAPAPDREAAEATAGVLRARGYRAAVTTTA